MTAIAWWISFSNLDTFLVKRLKPRRNLRCSVTANAVPVLLVGVGIPTVWIATVFPWLAVHYLSLLLPSAIWSVLELLYRLLLLLVA